jgi:phasin family protein
MDINKMMEQFKLPGVDVEKLLEARRKDIEAVVAANKHAYEGMQALVQRQTEILQDTMKEWQTVAKDMMSSNKPAEVAAKQAQLAQTAFSKALENMRELADMASKSQAQAYEVVKQRVQENMEELKKYQWPK